MVRLPIGYRIRAERKERGLTQAALAKEAGISPSYLNLIEANKREIGGALLKRITGLLGVEPDALTGRAEQRMITDLRELTFDPLIRHLNLTPDSTAEFVGRHPDWARALLIMHRAWLDQTSVTGALSDRLNQDPVLGDAVHQLLTHVTAIRSSSEILDDVPDMEEDRRRRFHQIISIESSRLSETARSLAGIFDQPGSVAPSVTPSDEVDDFMVKHNAWFPELEQLGGLIRERIKAEGGTDETSLANYLRAAYGTAVGRLSPDRPMPAGSRSPMMFDGERNRVTFPANAPKSTRRFQIARRIAHIEAAPAIEAQLQDPLLTSDTARQRARAALDSYVAGALLFPYREFADLAAGCRYDIEVMRQHYDASWEQVCHRLVTLRDPDRPGVPFALVRANPAGHITKRFPLPRLPLLRHGHACPLWAIFASFQSPDHPFCRLAEFPDGARYLMIARTVTRPPASFHEAPFFQAVMLICDVLHAGQTVYGDGLKLSSANAATPVGTSCRMCPRPDCRFRSEDVIPDAGAAPN